jgi:Fe-S-cluster containining protein
VTLIGRVAFGRRVDEADRESRKAELFAQLGEVHDLLTAYQDEHQKTPYGCMRSGACCQVGLELHMMECEHIAHELVRTRSPEELARVVRKLQRAFSDEGWNWGSSIGDDMCAFYEDGCTIYPFRPSVCRMYGVVIEVDDFCPRERLADGKSFVYVQKDVDRLIALYYRTLDNYGKLYPKLDRTVYMPAGVLSFLMEPDAYEALKARTPEKFWKREIGYRSQFVASYRRGEGAQTNVRFPFAIPKA